MAEKPEDLNLPYASICRIIKEILPEGVVISKETRSAITKAASVFVLYCTSCANNFALQDRRKTLKDSDVIAALQEMEFQQFIPSLKLSLEAFKREKKNTAEKRKRSRENVIKQNGTANRQNGSSVVRQNGLPIKYTKNQHNSL